MREREVPLGINTAVGAMVVLVCCVAPSGVDAQGRDARLAVLALGLAAFAATVGDLAAVAVTAGVAFLLFDGFVEGHQGDLVWNGRSDALHVALLVAAGLVGLLAGAVHRHRSRHRSRHRLRREAGMSPVPALPRQRPAAETTFRERDESDV